MLKHPLVSAVAALSIAVGAAVVLPASATAAAPDSPTAVVDASGALVSGSGAVSVTASGFGTYEVKFNRNVSTCAYTATATAPNIFVFVAGGHTGPRGVYLETKNPGGGLTPGGFHLSVWCGTSSKRAVIAADGTIVRGRKVVSVTTFPSLPGLYQVKFTASTNFCVATGTIGDTANGLVFSPASLTVQTPRLGPSRIIAIQINDLAVFGGVPSLRPFHVVLTCGEPGVRSATVVSDGTLATGTASSSTRIGVGSYRVTFPTSIVGCATSAVAAGEELTTAGQVWVTPTFRDASSVDVHTTDLDGTPADHAVAVLVSC